MGDNSAHLLGGESRKHLQGLTARILSRALASERVSLPASSDAIAMLLRASSDAAETVAGVAETLGATRTAAAVRKATQPEKIAETFAPLTRRIERMEAGWGLG